MTTNPRPPIEPKFSLKTADVFGEHVSQIAIDGQTDALNEVST